MARQTFEDGSKESLLRNILTSAAAAQPTGMIPADEHRARVTHLKRLKADRAARKAVNFAAHKKC